jgi:hypothetical protein
MVKKHKTEHDHLDSNNNQNFEEKKEKIETRHKSVLETELLQKNE